MEQSSPRTMKPTMFLLKTFAGGQVMRGVHRGMERGREGGGWDLHQFRLSILRGRAVPHRLLRGTELRGGRVDAPHRRLALAKGDGGAVAGAVVAQQQVLRALPPLRATLVAL